MISEQVPYPTPSMQGQEGYKWWNVTNMHIRKRGNWERLNVLISHHASQTSFPKVGQRSYCTTFQLLYSRLEMAPQVADCSSAKIYTIFRLTLSVNYFYLSKMLWSAIPLLLATFFSASAALQLYRIISRSYRSRKLSKQWNCEPVTSYPSGLFGHKAVWRLKTAAQEGQVGSTLHEGHLQYGNTLKLNLVGHDVVVTCEPENIQALLASQFSSFGLSKWRYPQYRPLLGGGIFTSDGSAWEHSRRLLRPQFTKNQVG